MVYFDDILIYSLIWSTYSLYIFNTLYKEQLYVNQKKCKFFTDIVAFFFCFIIYVDGVQADQCKIFTIMEQPTLRSIHDVWSFHNLLYFYRKFIKNLNSLIAPIIECLKGYTFQQTDETKTNFQMVKQKMTEATMLASLDFEKLFEINCDASRVGIGGVLSQDGHLIAFFNEKLSRSKKNYFRYDLEFYAIVHILKH